MFRNVNIEKEFCTAAPIKGSFGKVKVKCDFLFHVHDTINYRVSSKTVYTWFLPFFSSKSNPILTSRVSFEN